jgi:TrmH family RNA methyltransferase
MPTVLGPHNPRLDAVRELKTPRGRRDQGRFAIEGVTLIEEARRSGFEPRELYGTEAALAAHRGLVDPTTPVFVVPDAAFARISDVETPTGLLAVLDLPAGDLEAVLAGTGPVLLLAGVNDPGNAGTLVRSAEAFGAAGVLFGRGGVDPYSPKVVRAAMGSLFRLPLALVEPQDLLAAAAAAGRPVVATDTSGDDLDPLSLPANAILAIGNERRGVRDWLPRWDRAVRIPQSAQTESLNAAVAGSILLYAVARARADAVK